VSARVTFATARRVLSQIRHDRRSIALLLAVPAGLLILLRYVLDGRSLVFQAIGAPLCGLFPFIAMLRERTTGTLERLMTLPLAKLDLLAGYAIAFGVMAAAQALVVCTVGFALLGLDAPHGVWLVGALAVGNAVLGMALGLFVSAFARTEFQAVQFMPALVLPQLLLCGLSSPATRWRRCCTRSRGRCRSRTPTTHSRARPALSRLAPGSWSTWR
jgi:ABC-2 type transport system permease protein